MTTQERIALITDSTSDIPQRLVEQYRIVVVPQILIWGTEEHLDNVTISPQQFYARLATDPVHPSSSQPVASDFVKAIEQVRVQGAEEVVIIVLSNQLSGTVASALQAAQMVELPVHVVDSLSASMGLGFQVLAAARAREAGGDASSMIAAARQVRERLSLYFSVDTLEYLHRGGRIGGAAKLIGTALQLKPMLTIDHRTGRIEPAERTRTRRKALERIYEVFCQELSGRERLHVAVVHGNAPAEAAAFEDRLSRELKPVELLVTGVSPVVGVHAGPGVIGLCGYAEV